jgi:cytochrome c5
MSASEQSAADHDPHASFIKTPQQLIVVILLSFLVPIIGIILVVQLVMSRPSADPAALTPQSVAARLQPVGKLEIGETSGAAGAARSGEQIVKAVCAACHQTGVANAPKIGDAKAWAPHIKEGLKGMIATALKGKGAMPPRGGDASLSDADIERAVVFMANQSGAKFKEPAAPAAAPTAAASPAAPAAPVASAAAPHAQGAPAGGKPAAVDGKKVYDTTCMACHATGVANAPKVGDKAAWAPRVKQGMDTLIADAIKGKGAMPPKGGNMALSDPEVRAAVEYMVSQSK